MDYNIIKIICDIVSTIFVFIGGCFALYQWRKSLVYRRAEIVKGLIDMVTCNKSVATIMDIIDWDEDFEYDGKFVMKNDTTRKALQGVSNDDLFSMIDETLSTFTYICYLKSVNTITRKDMKFFEYDIRRVVDNKHISNYLYSLYHWSKLLNTTMSFMYLVEYCIHRKYLDKSFVTCSENEKYACFLNV